MSAESLHELAGWDGVCRSLAQIRTAHEEFDRFFCEVFEDLDALAGQMAQRHRAWQAGRSEAESDLEQRAAELDQQRAALVTQIEQVHRASHSSPEESDAASQRMGELAELRAAIEQDRSALHAAMDAAQAQASELADVVRELAQARAALSEARQELLRPSAEGGAAPVVGEADDVLREQLRQAEQERQAMEQERAVLETELEAVRNRAAEMAEMLAQQKRQMSEQRDQWSDELRRMRQMLEVLSGRLADVEAAPPQAAASRQATPESNGGAAPAAPGQADDAVLDSVMAQFQMLQKDRARRRERPVEAGQVG